MKREFGALLQELREIHADFKPIAIEQIEVAEWVRWKCRYGCKAYGKHLNCPPHVPSVEETRKLIACYEKAIITRFDAKPNPDVPPARIHHYLWDAITDFYNTMFELERHAFLAGYYKAFALVGLCCSYCEECLPEREGTAVDQAPTRFCLHAQKMRPGMENVGIDVFKTARNVGYAVEVLTSPHEPITFFGLLLIE